MNKPTRSHTIEKVAFSNATPAALENAAFTLYVVAIVTTTMPKLRQLTLAVTK
jgi:hypothetical protein